MAFPVYRVVTEKLKKEIKQRYGKIALTGNSDCCCMPGECSSGTLPTDAATSIGYDPKELERIPESAVLGVGCGAPIKMADLKYGQVVMDIGSGAGIDVFLAANAVGETGRVIGIDMTDEMLQKAQKNATDGKYRNVEFRKGDVEEGIPIDDATVDTVISNCVINLTLDKTKAFKEILRVLKNGGKMVISDLITSKEMNEGEATAEQWCACIDGALTKENYLASIKNAGFKDVEVLEERTYMEETENGQKITSLTIKAIKK